MHNIVATEGIVLRKSSRGEASVSASILTRHLGLISVFARSARRSESKLRYALEPFTRARFSLVLGVRGWKLTGALDISRALFLVSTERRATAARIARLLLRLLPEGDSQEALYTTVGEGLATLAHSQNAEVAESIECVLVLRILFCLGYLPHAPELLPFLEGDFSTVELAAEVKHSRERLILAINESLSASGL